MGHSVAPYKLKTPTFSGNVHEFQRFYDRFTDILKTHSDCYTVGDKCCLLAEAMEDPAAKGLVRKFSQGPSGYDTAMEQLRLRYGRASVIYPTYVKELIQRGNYDYTQDSMLRVIDRKRHLLDAMEKIKGNTLSQVAIALVLMDFNEELSKEWAEHLGSDDKLPNVDNLMKFITPLSHNLPSKSTSASTSIASKKSTHNKREDHNKTSSSTTSKSSCPLCKNGHHPLSRCSAFSDYTPGQRFNYVRQIKACVNCLHPSHQVGQCASIHSCRACKARHHSMLHKEDEPAATTPTSTNMMATVAPKTINSIPSGKTMLKCGFIHTALVILTNGDRSITVRAAMDTCSESCLLTERVTSHLRLVRSPLRMTMKGVNADTNLRHCVSVEVKPAFPSEDSVVLTMAVTPRLPASTPPPKKEDIISNPLLMGLQLADADFGGKVGVIIGTLDYPLCLNPVPTNFCPASRLSAVSTIFGWTVSGPLPSPSNITSLKIELKEDDLDSALQRLWELEKLPEVSRFSSEEDSAIQQFNRHLTRAPDGRYTVRLQRVDNPPPLGESRKMATSRFLSNEPSLIQKGKLDAYNQEMSSYLSLDRAEVVPREEINNPSYYMPINGVFKDTSTASKVRPVFDASAKTSSGHSLNDQLLPGPNRYPFISDIILQFRVHNIAFSADIGKMYFKYLSYVKQKYNDHKKK